MFPLRKKQGFTLIEILLVIGIIAVLATVVIVALDPAKRFADARNARRTSDIQSILSAVHQYVIDNKGEFPADLTNTEKQIGTATSGCEVSAGGCSVSGSGDCIDLSSLEKYLKTTPFDPQNGYSSYTEYSIVKDDNGIVTVRACQAENEEEISVSR